MEDERQVANHCFVSLGFGVYTSAEIKALSVKEVTNPQTFDNLQHPTYGGLYDPAFGPQEWDGVCTTCGLGTQYCPGHMGHIKLPLDVYNPVLFPILYQLLKGTCFHCHRLLLKQEQAKLFECQIRLLDHGLVSESEVLCTRYHGLLVEMGPQAVQEIIHKLESLTHQHITVLEDKDDAQRHSKVKHVTEAKQRLVKLFLRGKYFCNACVSCKTKRRHLRSEHGTKIFFASGAPTAQERKKALVMKKREAERRKQLQMMQENVGYEEEVEDEEEEEEQKSDEKMKNQTNQTYLTPTDVKTHLRQVWNKDKNLLKSMMGMLKVVEIGESCGVDIFFLDIMPVSPSRFRPVARMRDMSFEHNHTFHLCKVLTGTISIKDILYEIRAEQEEGSQDGATQKNTSSSSLVALPGKTMKEKLQNAWIRLQTSVNCVFDGDADKMMKDKDKKPGVKQLLEKKEGLFRKNMMGKRVNYACRSVISPDPYISTNEIGVPLVFAKKLTYPQPVTPWNFQELKQAIINGPDIHPGAIMVEKENGQCILLKSKDKTQREAIAKQLLTPSSGNKDVGMAKKVYRHLRNGDVMLLNRQPTLHRSSIQAHKARVLPGEKTLRLHYANCKAYNADFDGDEMNAHFPQNELGRAEAYQLMLTDYSYLVPKDGTPLAGLIQDHMVSGVQLMMRGRHFTQEEYQQLLFNALMNHTKRFKLVPPCIRKPAVLWSGKQLLTTLLLNIIPEGKPPLNLEGSAKVAEKNWLNGKPRMWRAGGSPLVGNDMSESEVVIHQGELLVGVLDKGHYGPAPYGLVHCVYELYGGPVAGKLLTGLARLFTKFLQWHGFTLGVEDILVTRRGNRRRMRSMVEGRQYGDQAAAKALNLPETSDHETVVKRYQEAHFNKDDGELKDLDLQMKALTDSIQNEIVNNVMPQGLCKKFPQNNLQLMVQTGAKGSNVNCVQISCLLGQIELEGRRPPLMLSGSYLPSFLPYDTSPRSGGFVDGRFLTGIRPQEYYFHCMAGREGLIDTAVKTSRSGYLQRCIIKHLEGLIVRYDTTVRDSDGSIVQFQYGEDGLDVMKTPFLNNKQFPFLYHNLQAAASDEMISELKDKLGASQTITLPDRVKCEPRKVQKLVKQLRKRHRKWEEHQTAGERLSPFLKWCGVHYDDILADYPHTGIDKHGRAPACTEAVDRWHKAGGTAERTKIESKLEFISHQPDPFHSILQSSRHFGCTNEKFEDTVEKFVDENSNKLFSDDIYRTAGEKISSFKELLHTKYNQAHVQPGESVGLIAAQSIGEPSTQMTLNTFHFAGRGEMNVTLGIPRLREILVVATANLKTPSMDIPVQNGHRARKKCKLLQQKFTKVYLSEILEDVEIFETLSLLTRGEKCRVYKMRFNFLPHEIYKKEFYLTPVRILAYMEKTFFSKLSDAIKKRLSDMSQSTLLHSKRLVRFKKDTEDTAETQEPASQALEDDGEDDILDDDLNDNDAAAVKLREKQQEERDYDGEDEERDVVAEQADSDVDDLYDESPPSITPADSEEEELTASTGEKLHKLKSKKQSKEMDPARVKVVIKKMYNAVDYVYDADAETWCEITLHFPLKNKKIDLSSLVQVEAKRGVVTQTPGITRGFLTESKKTGEEGQFRLKTEGINIKEMYNYHDILDLNQIYTNDIHAMANTYGIEAASRVIVKEIRDVFAAYGIQVDYRHLSLIADYMTFEGTYKPFSRGGIESNASPLQKITFETSMNFLKIATVQGIKDDLSSPSSRIVVGRLVDGGTGSFDLLQRS